MIDKALSTWADAMGLQICSICLNIYTYDSQERWSAHAYRSVWEESLQFNDLIACLKPFQSFATTKVLQSRWIYLNSSIFPMLSRIRTRERLRKCFDLSAFNFSLNHSNQCSQALLGPFYESQRAMPNRVNFDQFCLVRRGTTLTKPIWHLVRLSWTK